MENDNLHLVVGVTDMECFSIQGNTYLTVANYRNNIGRLETLSDVYKYNLVNRRFERSQYLPTKVCFCVLNITQILDLKYRLKSTEFADLCLDLEIKN